MFLVGQSRITISHFAAALLTFDFPCASAPSAAAGLVTIFIFQNYSRGKPEYLFVEDPLDFTTFVNNTA